MRKHTYWTTGEIEDLRYLKTYEKLSNKEDGIALGRTEISIITQSKKCKILKRTRQSIKNKVWELKKKGVKFEEQFIPRFHPGAKGYIIFSQKTGKIIKRYNTLEEWARE